MVLTYPKICLSVVSTNRPSGMVEKETHIYHLFDNFSDLVFHSVWSINKTAANYISWIILEFLIYIHYHSRTYTNDHGIHRVIIRVRPLDEEPHQSNPSPSPRRRAKVSFTSPVTRTEPPAEGLSSCAQLSVRSMEICLVVFRPTPLKNDGVRQLGLGWWNSQYMESHNPFIFQTSIDGGSWEFCWRWGFPNEATGTPKGIIQVMTMT